jgi:hypothetical protein
MFLAYNFYLPSLLLRQGLTHVTLFPQENCMTNPCPPECLAAVQEAQTQNNEAQASNNAQVAQLLGRLSAPSVAAIPAQAGVYHITAGAEAGQVWERLPVNSGGGKERRPELEAASRTQVQNAQQTATLTNTAISNTLAGLGGAAPPTAPSSRMGPAGRGRAPARQTAG